MSRLFASDYTIAEYRAHLGRLLGFFEPLERIASRAANAEGSARPPERSSDLREDLRIVGATASDIDAFERCPWLPPIAPGGLRGCTYVILGSILGGRIIARQLRATLGQDVSLRFYGDGDGRFESAWASFRLDLEENGKDDAEAICATAVAVFDAYAAWFSEPLPQTGAR
jgi:heme oxygenase